jgi:C-terminal processing protease CtpA/Prc
MLANGSQMPVIVSDRFELRRCVMHLWPNYNGIGLNIKPSRSVNKIPMPHVVKGVDLDSPAHYAGVLSNDFIIKIDEKLVEHEKFDTILKLIKEQLKKDKKVSLLLLNSVYYGDFKRRNDTGDGRRIDYNSPKISAQTKYYESPQFNPNTGSLGVSLTSPSSNTNTIKSVGNLASLNSNYQTLGSNSGAALIANDLPPEPRLCHLLTWSNYDGYGFYVAYSNESGGCYIKTVEPNSPAQLGGLKPYDRLIELNGKQVTVKDKELIMKEINKYKMQMNASTTKSNKSTRSKSSTRQNYLNLFVVDPSTYNWLNSRRVDISTRNKNLKIQECFTPPENSLLALMEAQKNMNNIQNGTMKSNLSILRFNDSQITSNPAITTLNQTNQQAAAIVAPVVPPPPTIPTQKPFTQLNQAILDSIILKYCTIRRLKNSDDKPLGFEMTKRGQTAHFISRVEPASAAALGGLCVDDYLIELNEKNIEKDDNNLLREKIFHCLDPANDGEFKFTTMNKLGYEYCLENNIEPGYFIQLNKFKIKIFETPKELSQSSKIEAETKVPKPQQVIETSPHVIIESPLPSGLVSPSSPTFRTTPRMVVLRKGAETRELGFSIIRMKNHNDHIINDVIPGSLAERSGLKVNDCLLEVNGENVENKSHLETVNRIHELTKQPLSEINLLVIEKNLLKLRSPSVTSVLSTNIAKVQHIPNSIVGASGNTTQTVTTVLNNNVHPPLAIEKTQIPKHNDRKIITNHLVMNQFANEILTQLPPPPSINVYPEIKICEFLGYPKGTQLGLVITSDEYSHDIIKVADGSPAQKAGLQEGDCIVSINDIQIEGNPSAIDLLNDFDEFNALKILVASRYALEWSKLLRIKITERDWPNVKKFITTNNNKSLSYNAQPTSPPPPPEFRAVNNNNTNVRSVSPFLPSNCYYQPPPLNYTTKPQQQINYNNTIKSTKNASFNAGHEGNLFTLSRSAVDITTDGRVLRLCTLLIDPNSRIPLESEFGFDLVTKIGANQKIGDYYIDTVDEDSPAAISGLKPGDRLFEVDGIDLSTKTFEQVVQYINDAKQRGILKLLVYPSIIINYGNPNVHKEQPQPPTLTNLNYQDTRSMPDLTVNELANNNYYYFNNNVNNNIPNPNSKTFYRQKKSLTKHTKTDSNNINMNHNNDYDSIYLKRNSVLNNANSKSVANINETFSINNTSTRTVSIPNMANQNNSSASLSDFLKPMPRLCTIIKNNNDNLSSTSLSNSIGFGVHMNRTSTLVPNYLRVSIVNYKSPAYFAGLEPGDYIIEINSRNILSMSHEDALHFIKQSFEMNGSVRLLVVSEFCYNWLREHNLMYKMSSEDQSVFSYSDYLRSAQRYVPRLCKIKLYPYSKSFGFTIDSFNLTANSPNSQPSFAHLITSVETETPAFAAGLLKNDRIIECEGVNVENEDDRQINDRISQALLNVKQICLFVVDPDTDRFFKSKCIKLHSMLPIVQHITNTIDN